MAQLAAHTELDARLEPLLQAAISGDRSAFDAFAAEALAELRVFVGLRSTNAAMTEEVVQATLVRAFHGLAGFRRDGRPMAWLKGIARNVLREELRRLGRMRTDATALLDQAVATDLLALIDEEVTDRQEAEAAALRSCLAALPAESRAIVEQKYQQALPVAQIARRNERSEAAIAGVLRRARAALRNCLRRSGVLP